jgi:hypothetical protein
MTKLSVFLYTFVLKYGFGPLVVVIIPSYVIFMHHYKIG